VLTLARGRGLGWLQELLREENNALRDKLSEFKRELKEGSTARMDVEGNEEDEEEEEEGESTKPKNARLSAAEALRIKILSGSCHRAPPRTHVTAD
jgi:CO dehydrogenase/acetyl-CoA synthase beta subunit